MSTSSYRFRQPAWLWAILGSLLSGLAAAAAFSLILVLTLWFMELASLTGSFAGKTDSSWLMVAGIAVVLTMGAATPVIAPVSVVSAFTLNAVRKRQKGARSYLLTGYEWLIWATVFGAAVAYPWIVKFMGLDTIWGPNYYNSAFPFLLVLAVSLACAHIARPIFYRIVSQTLPAEHAQATVPDTASVSDHAHAPA